MVERMHASSSLVEVVDRILDKGIAIDKFLAFLQSPAMHTIQNLVMFEKDRGGRDVQS